MWLFRKHKKKTDETKPQIADSTQLSKDNGIKQPSSTGDKNRRNEEFEKRLVDATDLFEKHLGVAPLSEHFWYPQVQRDPSTNTFYVWEIRWSAADPGGWHCIGSFEDAVRFIESGRR